MKISAMRNLLVLLTISLALVACSTPVVNPVPQQQSWASSQEASQYARIYAFEEEVFLSSNIWTVVKRMDGAEIDRSRRELKQPLLVVPGKHQLHLVRLAGFKHATLAVVSVDVSAGQQLQIRSAWKPRKSPTWVSDNYLWLEDVKTEKAVTPETLAKNLWSMSWQQ